MLAHTNGDELWKECRAEIRRNPERKRSMEFGGKSPQGSIAGTSARLIKPRVDRTGDGIPNRMDRHRSLGNAVVPVQAKEAFERLMGLSAREVLKEIEE